MQREGGNQLRVLYQDELRVGDSTAGFADVTPRWLRRSGSNSLTPVPAEAGDRADGRRPG